MKLKGKDNLVLFTVYFKQCVILFVFQRIYKFMRNSPGFPIYVDISENRVLSF